MDENTLTALIADQLPFEQAFDFIKWACVTEYRSFWRSPELAWWVERHAGEVVRITAEVYL